MSNYSHKTQGLAAMGLAMGLLIFALAYAYASARVLLYQPLLNNLSDDSAARPDVSDAVEAYVAAFAGFPPPQIAATRARLSLASARLQQGETWPQVIVALEQSVQINPRDPLSWARLAYAQNQIGQDDEARSSLAESFARGHYMQEFMQWRFVLGLKLMPGMNQQQLSALADQAFWLWKKRPRSFIGLARMAPISSQVETLITVWNAQESTAFLRRRGKLEHTP